MVKLEYGDIVKFTNAERHKLMPNLYPPVGTYGVVKGIKRDVSYVMWNGSTRPACVGNQDLDSVAEGYTVEDTETIWKYKGRVEYAQNSRYHGS